MPAPTLGGVFASAMGTGGGSPVPPDVSGGSGSITNSTVKDIVNKLQAMNPGDLPQSDIDALQKEIDRLSQNSTAMPPAGPSGMPPAGGPMMP